MLVDGRLFKKMEIQALEMRYPDMMILILVKNPFAVEMILIIILILHVALS